MAKNNLTPEQDLIVRDFYTEVLADESLFPDDPVSRRQGLALCRRLLGYMVVSGKHIGIDKADNLKTPFGSLPDLPDEWADDTRRAMDATNQNTDTNEADSGVEAESSEVREAVLSEDV